MVSGLNAVGGGYFQYGGNVQNGPNPWVSDGSKSYAQIARDAGISLEALFEYNNWDPIYILTDQSSIPPQGTYIHLSDPNLRVTRRFSVTDDGGAQAQTTANAVVSTPVGSGDDTAVSRPPATRWQATDHAGARAQTLADPVVATEDMARNAEQLQKEEDWQAEMAARAANQPVIKANDGYYDNLSPEMKAHYDAQMRAADASRMGNGAYLHNMRPEDYDANKDKVLSADSELYAYAAGPHDQRKIDQIESMGLAGFETNYWVADPFNPASLFNLAAALGTPHGTMPKGPIVVETQIGGPGGRYVVVKTVVGTESTGGVEREQHQYGLLDRQGLFRGIMPIGRSTARGLAEGRLDPATFMPTPEGLAQAAQGVIDVRPGPNAGEWVVYGPDMRRVDGVIYANTAAEARAIGADIVANGRPDYRVTAQSSGVNFASAGERRHHEYATEVLAELRAAYAQTNDPGTRQILRNQIAEIDANPFRAAELYPIRNASNTGNRPPATEPVGLQPATVSVSAGGASTNITLRPSGLFDVEAVSHVRNGTTVKEVLDGQKAAITPHVKGAMTDKQIAELAYQTLHLVLGANDPSLYFMRSNDYTQAPVTRHVVEYGTLEKAVVGRREESSYTPSYGPNAGIPQPKDKTSLWADFYYKTATGEDYVIPVRIALEVESGQNKLWVHLLPTTMSSAALEQYYQANAPQMRIGSGTTVEDYRQLCDGRIGEYHAYFDR